MLKYGETTSIRMIINGKRNHAYSASNPITGIIQVNASDYPLKTTGIRMTLLRKDLSHFINKKKDIFGGDFPGGTRHNH